MSTDPFDSLSDLLLAEHALFETQMEALRLMAEVGTADQRTRALEAISEMTSATEPNS